MNLNFGGKLSVKFAYQGFRPSIVIACLLACVTPQTGAAPAGTLDKPPSLQLVSQLTADRAAKLKAIASLMKYGHWASNALPDLTKLLKDPDLDVEAHAASCILTIDSERIDARQTVTSLLKNRDPAVREQTAFATGQAGRSALPVVKELIATLQGDISPKVRDRAAWAIGQIGPDAKEAMPTVIDALKKNHPLQDYHGRGVDGLDGTIYKTCVKTLGEIGTGSKQACDILASMAIDQTKANLQDDALRALSAMGTGAVFAVPILAGQIANAFPERKLALIKILKNMGPTANEALPQLQECLQSKEPGLRHAALEAILTIQGNEKDKQNLLAHAVNDPDENIQQDASAALANSTAASPESMKALMQGTADSKLEVRIASMKSLGNYGALAEDALPMLIKANLGSSAPPQQRKAAYEAIKRIDPSGRKTIPLLSDCLKDAFRVRAALELLDFIGSPQCQSVAKAQRAQWHM